MSVPASNPNSYGMMGDGAPVYMKNEQFGEQNPFGMSDPGTTPGNGAQSETRYSHERDTTIETHQDVHKDVLVAEMKNEVATLNPLANKHAVRMLNDEIERLSEDVIEPEWLEVDVPQQIKVSKKVLIPVNREPRVRFNFVGKLLGPGGKTLQSLVQASRCRIYILGRGSSRDKSKEQELLDSGDPKYAHYKERLHVKVETVAPSVVVAFQRLTYVLEQLEQFLQPVKDDIYSQQMAEMGNIPSGGQGGRGGMRPNPMGSGRGGAGGRGGGPGQRGRGYLMDPPRGGPAGGGDYSGYTEDEYAEYGGYEDYQAPQYGAGPPARGPPPMGPGGGTDPQAGGFGTGNVYEYGHGYNAYQPYGVDGGGRGRGQARGGKAPPGRGRGGPRGRGVATARPAPY